MEQASYKNGNMEQMNLNFTFLWVIALDRLTKFATPREIIGV